MKKCNRHPDVHWYILLIRLAAENGQIQPSAVHYNQDSKSVDSDKVMMQWQYSSLREVLVQYYVIYVREILEIKLHNFFTFPCCLLTSGHLSISYIGLYHLPFSWIFQLYGNLLPSPISLSAFPIFFIIFTVRVILSE